MSSGIRGQPDRPTPPLPLNVHHARARRQQVMNSRIISATQNLARGHVIVATGEGFSTTLPARSVTTFVATTR